MPFSFPFLKDQGTPFHGSTCKKKLATITVPSHPKKRGGKTLNGAQPIAFSRVYCAEIMCTIDFQGSSTRNLKNLEGKPEVQCIVHAESVYLHQAIIILLFQDISLLHSSNEYTDILLHWLKRLTVHKANCQVLQIKYIKMCMLKI